MKRKSLKNFLIFEVKLLLVYIILVFSFSALLQYNSITKDAERLRIELKQINNNESQIIKDTAINLFTLNPFGIIASINNAENLGAQTYVYNYKVALFKKKVKNTSRSVFLATAFMAFFYVLVLPIRYFCDTE